MNLRNAEVGKKIRAAFPSSIKSIDPDTRTITFIASTQNEDRYGDCVMVEGWDTSNYAKNPVFLWAHDSSQLPIGKCVGLAKQMGSKPALVQKIQFATADENPFADNVFKLYKGGYLSAVSVGFIPHEMSLRMDEETGYITGYDFTKQELLELSAVPVPANSEALALAMKSSDGISGVELCKLAIKSVIDKAVADKVLDAAAGESVLGKFYESFVKSAPKEQEVGAIELPGIPDEEVKEVLGNDNASAVDKVAPKVDKASFIADAFAELKTMVDALCTDMKAVSGSHDSLHKKVDAIKECVETNYVLNNAAPAAETKAADAPAEVPPTVEEAKAGEISDAIAVPAETKAAEGEVVPAPAVETKDGVIVTEVIPEVPATVVDKAVEVVTEDKGTEVPAAVVVDPLESFLKELVVVPEVKSSPELTQAVDGETTQKIAPELSSDPDPNLSTGVSVKSFLAALLTK